LFIRSLLTAILHSGVSIAGLLLEFAVLLTGRSGMPVSSVALIVGLSNREWLRRDGDFGNNRVVLAGIAIGFDGILISHR